jgi:anti-sigma regulatory factor (Ser/Thr protein kinase)
MDLDMAKRPSRDRESFDAAPHESFRLRTLPFDRGEGCCGATLGGVDQSLSGGSGGGSCARASAGGLMRRADAAQTMTLVGEPRDVLLARAFARRALADKEADAVVDDAVAVVSELVTNSVMHGRGPIVATIVVESGAVEISVADTARAIPAPRDPGVEDEGGRGLQIVARLADRWWTEVTDRGKTTTAHLSLLRRR